MKELQLCMEAVYEVAELARSAVVDNDPVAAQQVEPLEDVIDVLTKELKSRHIQRLQSGHCTLMLGFIYNDCMNNFERVADHCSNIAVALLEADTDIKLQSHDYLRAVKQGDQAYYSKQMDAYADHYLGKLSTIEVIPAAE